MSNAQTRLESLRASVREDVRYVTDLLGREPEVSKDFRVWNDATNRLQRVSAVFEALGNKPLAQLSRVALECCHLMASQQFTNNSEVCQRLLATLHLLADHPHLLADSSSPEPNWFHALMAALGAETIEPAATTSTNPSENHNLQAIASQYVKPYQAALLNWLTGRDQEQALATLVRILKTLQQHMSGTSIAQLAELSEFWRSRSEPLDGHARQCLSRAERLLQQMASGEDHQQRANELNEKMAPLLEALPATHAQHLRINIDHINKDDYWRPPHPAPADQETWTGLAAALRDDLRYVIESLDIATRVAPSQAPDMRLVAERLTTAADVLCAAGLTHWAQQLAVLADKVSQGPGRSECLPLAEAIQDVAACLEAEVIEHRLKRPDGASAIATQVAVAELARTAVVDAALASIARLSARFEIIATSDFRPSHLKPTEEIEALWGVARALNWKSLSDATAWLRSCAQQYLESEANSHDILSALLTGCVVVERFLQTVRLPWPNMQQAENEMLDSLQQLAPTQFARP